MKEALTLYLGVFGAMALSNAIVPVLPYFAEGPAAQGTIYSAYFLGAFILTLPAGLMCDRWGSVPIIKAGLFLTVASGLLFFMVESTMMVLVIRLIEGFGAGLFVPAALALANASPKHERMTGHFMAMLNIGLLSGLIGTGWLVTIVREEMTGYCNGLIFQSQPVWQTGVVPEEAGLILFTAVSAVPFLASLFLHADAAYGRDSAESLVTMGGRLVQVLKNYFWLWISAVVMVGITGAVTAIYPEFSGGDPYILGLQIAAMNLSTAIAAILASRMHLQPIPAIRIAALASAAAVVITMISPSGFIILGGCAGVVMIAQLAFLAKAESRQGPVIGLFNSASYGGMTIIPFIAGFIAEFSFFMAFLVTAAFAITVALTIGRCGCSLTEPGENRL